MNSSNAHKRYEYFLDSEGASSFKKSFALLVAEKNKIYAEQFVSKHNTYRIKHGGDFENPGAPQAMSGDIKKLAAFAEIKFEDLMTNNLAAIEHNLQQLIETMNQKFSELMYSTMGAACELSGNTVDGRSGKPITELIMEAIEKIEFFADKSGEVSLPEIHMHPDMLPRLAEAMDEASPEYNAQFEALKERKIREAREREIERKAKFVRYGEST